MVGKKVSTLLAVSRQLLRSFAKKNMLDSYQTVEILLFRVIFVRIEKN